MNKLNPKNYPKLKFKINKALDKKMGLFFKKQALILVLLLTAITLLLENLTN